MNWTAFVSALADFFNSGFGFALIWAGLVVLFAWLSSKWNPFEKTWEKYEGSIITGIKLAEKNVPDDTPNAGLAKLDSALRFVLKAYADAHGGKQPSAKVTEQLKQGIQIKHADLDRFGGLSTPGNSTA